MNWLRYANQGATRNQPIHPNLASAMGSFLPNMGVTGFGAGPGYMQPGAMHIGHGNPGVRRGEPREAGHRTRRAGLRKPTMALR